MAKKPYSTAIRTPYGRCYIEADSWEELVMLCPGAVSVVLDPESEICEEILARETRDRYRACFGSNRKTRIEARGLELDLVKCFLRGMTIKDAISWLWTEKYFTSSGSAVGRYWSRLRLLNIVKPNR